MQTIHTLDVEAGDAGERLDKFLSRRLPDFSRSRLQALIESGCVARQGTAIEDASAKVKPGERYALTVPEAKPSHLVAQDIPLEIVHEDDHLLVINKPAGLTVHPGAGNPDMTLVNALMAHCGASLSGVGGVARPGIVHRIDKDTSGLLVAAKNDAAHVALSKQLADRSLKRTYKALVWGTPKTKQGTVTGNIARSRANRQKMAVVNKGGKPAVTHYKVISDQWPVASRKNNLHQPPTTDHRPLFSLLECNLETGRTHQIRVHLTHIGHPLVGDPAYGQPTAQRLRANIYKSLPEKTRAALLAFNRQALHAAALEFIHPATGKKMRFAAALPEDMQYLLSCLGLTQASIVNKDGSSA